MPRKRELCAAGEIHRDGKRFRGEIFSAGLAQHSNQHLLHSIETTVPCRFSSCNSLQRWKLLSAKLQTFSCEGDLATCHGVRRVPNVKVASITDHLCPGCLMPLQPVAVSQRPSVYVPSCQKWFDSLSLAVHHASEAETITLDAGIYVEHDAIILDKANITIRATNDDPSTDKKSVQIVSHTVNQHCFIFKATGCSVSGLDILHMACSDESVHPSDAPLRTQSAMHVDASQRGGISIELGDGIVEDCKITSISGYGVMVWADSRPTISGSSIENCAQAAVICGGRSAGHFFDNKLIMSKSFGCVVVDEAGGLFERNCITRSSKCGILCAGKSEAEFRDNCIIDGGQGGVWIRNSSRVKIIGNWICRNAKAGLQAGDNCDPHVERNIISDGKNGGAVLHGNARGTFIGNTMSGHVQAGFGIMDDAAPLLIGNTLDSNAAGGAIVAGRSKSIWQSNVVSNNGIVGIGVKEDAVAHICGGAVVNNRGHGLLLQGMCKTILQDTAVHSNSKVGIICTGNTRLEARNCAVRAGKGQCVGLQCMEQPSVSLDRCMLQGHESGNLVVQDRSSVSVRRCHIVESAWAGVVLQGSSHASICHSTISQNGTGMLTMDKARWVCEGSTFADASGIGIMAAGCSQGDLIQSNCASNGGAGLLVKGSAETVVKNCRFSWNGVGVSLDETCTSVFEDNCSFENVGSALHLGGSALVNASNNVLASGTGKGSMSARLDGPCTGTLSRNVVDSFEAQDVDTSALCFDNNVVSGTEQVKASILQLLAFGMVGPRVCAKQVAVACDGNWFLGVEV